MSAKENELADFFDPEHLKEVNPRLVYLASPLSHPSPRVMGARLEAVRHVCGEMIKQGVIIYSPLAYSCEMDRRGFRPPQGWYAFDLPFLARADELLVLQLPGWEQSKGIIMEMAAARTKGLPVRYLALEDAGIPAETVAGLSE